MKLETIEKKIRYGNKPYSEIYKKAEKAGLRVKWHNDGEYTTVIAYDESNHFAKSIFSNEEPTQAIYNEYSF